MSVPGLSMFAGNIHVLKDGRSHGSHGSKGSKPKLQEKTKPLIEDCSTPWDDIHCREMRVIALPELDQLTSLTCWIAFTSPHSVDLRFLKSNQNNFKGHVHWSRNKCTYELSTIHRKFCIQRLFVHYFLEPIGPLGWYVASSRHFTIWSFSRSSQIWRVASMVRRRSIPRALPWDTELEDSFGEVELRDHDDRVGWFKDMDMLLYKFHNFYIFPETQCLKELVGVHS